MVKPIHNQLNVFAKKIEFLILFFALIFCSTKSYSWGSKGHKIVAEIAYQYLNKATQDSVTKYLGSMSIEDAATWMDDVRKDSTYNYLKPWHYINVEKNNTYIKSTQEDIINELTKAIDDLKQKNARSKEQLFMDIKVLFHLVGDLHQPLHVGYGVDKGGNSIDVKFLGKKSNLHKVWDSEIIEQKKITIDDCLKLSSSYSKRKIKKTQKINVVKWMNQSRSLLPNVYNVTDDAIDQKYIDRNTLIIKEQLVVAGLRLAAVLNATFK